MSRTLPSLALLLLAIVAYVPGFPGHFFMDDLPIVNENPLVLNPDLWTILTTDYWGIGANSGLHRPLTILAFALNRVLLGYDPWGFLLVNVLLHAGVTLIFYALLSHLGVSRRGGWLAAALFAVHPLHSEAVIELVGRAELLVALFVLLGLYLALRQGRGHRLAVGLCFLAALLAKEHGIVLLALLPAIDLYRCRSGKSTWQGRLPLYALLVGIALGWLLFRSFAVVRTQLPPDSFSLYYVPLSTLTYPVRVLMALKVQLLYLGKMLFPWNLQGMYPASTVLPPHSWLSLPGLLVATAVLLAGGAMVWGWRRRQLWALAALLYAISFAPTSNLFVLSAVTMADRLCYLPSLWFCLALSQAVMALPSVVTRPRLASGVMLGLVALYAVAGLARSRDFRTPETLWRSDLAINPRNELSLLFLGDELWRQKRIDEAEGIFLRLLGIAPDFSRALISYAQMLVENGRYGEAIGHAKKAIANDVNRDSEALIPLAGAYLKTGRLNDAVKILERTRGAFGHMPIYWELLGKAWEAKGDRISALECYQQEIRAAGGRITDSLQRIGKLQLLMEMYADAEQTLRRDLELLESPESWNSLGAALVFQGRNAEARMAFARAVELSPDNGQYRANLERVSLDLD